MKRFVLLLLLINPILSWAQVNDMYFVPKKENKVLTVKSAEDFYLIDDNSIIVEESDSVDYLYDTENAYFTNNIYDVIDEYTYSNRIIRFMSTGRMLSSNLYWDLKYDCGVNDWLVYDDGYAVYIYPTANNYYYSYPRHYSWINRWNWDSYYYYHNWYNPYYDNWCYYNYHCHNPHFGYGTPSKPWRPSTYRSENIPTNGRFATTRGTTAPREERPGRVTAGDNISRGGQPTRTVGGSSNPRREQLVRTVNGSNNPSREQQARTVSTNNTRGEQTTRTVGGSSNPRREQQVRTVNGSNNPRREQQTTVNRNVVRSSTSGTAVRQQQTRTSVNSSNAGRVSTSSSSGSSVRRSGSSSGSSSGGYSRPSSTSSSRSSSYSGSSSSYGGSSGSYSRGGSSSGSGGGARSSSSRR